MRLPIIVFLLLNSLTSASGQSSLSLFHLLDSLGGVRISLAYPFDSLFRTNQNEIPATIHITTHAGVLFDNEPVTIQVRGKFRRMKCDLPPLDLNFKKSTLRRMGLNEHDNIKLVTHCLLSQEGEKNLAEEYLCYKIYGAITPFSFRTIWIDASYSDKNNQESGISAVAFLIEPDEDIADRLGLVEQKRFNVTEDSLHFDSYRMTAAFNCLIGNMDWDVVMSRNIKLFMDTLQSRFVIIPYDFDYSNIVNPSYRRETRSELMVNTYDRYYQGTYFKTRAPEILKSFLPYEQAILNTVESFENPMDDGRRKQISRYLATWFDDVEKLSADKLQYGAVIRYKGGL